MGFLKKLRGTLSKDKEHVPPPPAPGHHPEEESTSQAAQTTQTFAKHNLLESGTKNPVIAPADDIDVPPTFSQQPQDTSQNNPSKPAEQVIPHISLPPEVVDPQPLVPQKQLNQDPIPQQRPEQSTSIATPQQHSTSAKTPQTAVPTPSLPMPKPQIPTPPPPSPGPRTIAQSSHVNSHAIPEVVQEAPSQTPTPWFREETPIASAPLKQTKTVEIKDNPAHDEPFFSQKPREDLEITHSKLVSSAKTHTPTPKTLPTQTQPPVQQPVRQIPDVLSDIPEDSPETIARMLRDIPSPEPKVTETELDIEDAPTFHLHDGRVVAGPTSLAMIAQDMSDDVFAHHVTADRNDFATWIKDGLKQPALAARVNQATSPRELFQVLSTYHGAVSSTKPLPDLPTTPPQPKQQGVDVNSLKQAFSEITSELEQASAMQASLDQEKTELEERENSLLAREQAFKQSMESFELERAQTQQALSETTRLRDELRRRHVELTELELSLEAHKQRLEVAQARKPEPVSAPARTLSHDVREDSFAQVARTPNVQPAPHEPSPDAHAVLDAVERAHKSLINNDVAQARALYSSARELFYSTQLPEGERRELYNLIRELYTDIELSRIS